VDSGALRVTYVTITFGEECASLVERFLFEKCTT